MQSTQKSRWLVNAALFAGFILAFLLNLTGLAVHQWLGLAVFAAAIYHLFDHDSKDFCYS
jgi:ABC-type Fe3+ transport system permease subunit